MDRGRAVLPDVSATGYGGLCLHVTHGTNQCRHDGRLCGDGYEFQGEVADLASHEYGPTLCRALRRQYRVVAQCKLADGSSASARLCITHIAGNHRASTRSGRLAKHGPASPRPTAHVAVLFPVDLAPDR